MINFSKEKTNKKKMDLLRQELEPIPRMSPEN